MLWLLFPMSHFGLPLSRSFHTELFIHPTDCHGLLLLVLDADLAPSDLVVNKTESLASRNAY